MNPYVGVSGLTTYFFPEDSEKPINDLEDFRKKNQFIFRNDKTDGIYILKKLSSSTLVHSKSTEQIDVFIIAQSNSHTAILYSFHLYTEQPPPCVSFHIVSESFSLTE